MSWTASARQSPSVCQFVYTAKGALIFVWSPALERDHPSFSADRASQILQRLRPQIVPGVIPIAAGVQIFVDVHVRSRRVTSYGDADQIVNDPAGNLVSKFFRGLRREKYLRFLVGFEISGAAISNGTGAARTIGDSAILTAPVPVLSIRPR